MAVVDQVELPWEQRKREEKQIEEQEPSNLRTGILILTLTILTVLHTDVASGRNKVYFFVTSVVNVIFSSFKHLVTVVGIGNPNRLMGHHFSLRFPPR